MPYPLENLTPEKFQQFCQALLVRQFPNLQCLPVGQPDGGRDAWLDSPTPAGKRKRKRLIFQIKFIRDPSGNSEPGKKLLATMEKELEKLNPSVIESASQYILITNISGSSHLDRGSIDKLQNLLSEKLPVPSQTWWRDDIERRLESAWSLKWSYPELMTGPDLLRSLIESGLHEDRERRANAIRGFVADQFTSEQEVKFKQVELQNQLFELFVDVPCMPPQPRSERASVPYATIAYSRVARFAASASRPVGSDVDDDPFAVRRERSSVGAATLLLDGAFQEAVPLLVLEGAPGQGKSTITQYICQVHRARLLRKDSILDTLPVQHLSGSVRLPFRVDLRDLAMWLARRDPFDSANVSEPTGWAKSVEAFLAAQVRYASGGADFSVSDLHAVLQTSAVVVAFDGLDEVADVERRREVVDEVERATQRLSQTACSFQAIVTSRPAAFANSPGPNEKRFPYFHLTSLPPDLVIDYSERWLKSKRMPGPEAGALRKLLKQKLTEAHMRELSRNPMQLAILLSLMHTRGASLPDKRTALYDSYVDLFFSREAEKSVTVREHRELLVEIHRYLAWQLQCEAQEGAHNGGITSDRLRETVRTYLETEGHDTSLADSLFNGMIERVVALVSRVEGMYEFEVQPLREYFAARFLYETAPYSPVGKPRSGTRPDRFDALSRDLYWLNVTRFYAGCFSKGELPSLVDRIQQLLTEAPYSYTFHPRALSAMLLSDWVFSQHPRSVTALVELLLSGTGLREISTALSNQGRASTPIVLPKSSGRDELAERAFRVLQTFPPRDYTVELTEIVRANGSTEHWLNRWLECLPTVGAERALTWVEIGKYLGVVASAPEDRLVAFCSSLSALRQMQVLYSARRSSVYGQLGGASAQDDMIQALVNLEIQPLRPRLSRSPTNYYEMVSTAVDPVRYHWLTRSGDAVAARQTWRRFGDDGGWLDALPTGGGADELLSTFAALSQRTSPEWSSDRSIWQTMEHAICSIRADAWSAIVLACVSSGVVPSFVSNGEEPPHFFSEESWCLRFARARTHSGSIHWWQASFQAARTKIQTTALLMAAFVWATGRALMALLPILCELHNTLTSADRELLFGLLQLVDVPVHEPGRGRGRHWHLTEIPLLVPDELLPLITPRLRGPARRDIYVCRLASYRGADQSVLAVAQEFAIDAIHSSHRDWERDLNVISHSYVAGATSGALASERYRRTRDDSMPAEFAIMVLSNSHAYPSSIVQSAHGVCSEAAAKELITVGAVAKRDGWFDT